MDAEVIVVKFSQLTLTKIIKTVATRCQILRLKCTKFNFGWGSVPDPAWWASSVPPDHLAGFKGPTSKGRGGDGGIAFTFFKLLSIQYKLHRISATVENLFSGWLSTCATKSRHLVNHRAETHSVTKYSTNQAKHKYAFNLCYTVYKGQQRIFTVQLRVMQCTVLLSQFCPSVCLSDACIVTKLHDAVRIFWYNTKFSDTWHLHAPCENGVINLKLPSVSNALTYSG